MGKRIKDLSRAATDGYLAVDNAANGTGKMLTSVIFNNFAGKFVPNETEAKEGLAYVYEGNLYRANSDYSGSWDWTKFTKISAMDFVMDAFGYAVYNLVLVDYQNLISRMQVGEFAFNTSTKKVIRKTGTSSYLNISPKKNEFFVYEEHLYIFNGTGLVLFKDNYADVPYYDFNRGYVNTGANVGDTISLTPTISESWMSQVIAAEKGDVFFVTGAGGSSSRLWAFLDADNKLLSVANVSTFATNLKITAPTNAAKLVVNMSFASPSYGHEVKQRVFFQEFATRINEKVAALETDDSSNKTKIQVLEHNTNFCNIGLENGGVDLGHGYNIPASNRCRTISYLYGSCTLSVRSGFQIYAVIYYDKATKAFASTQYVRGQSVSIAVDGTKVFRLSFAKSDATQDIDVTELKDSIFIEEIYNKVNEINNRLTAIETKRQPMVLFDYHHDLKDVSSVISGFTMAPVTGIMAQVISFFDALVTAHPNYVEKVDLPSEVNISYPEAWGANKMYMYKFIHTNDDIYSATNKRKKLFITGGLHGDEMAAPVNLCLFAKNLCECSDGNYYKLRSAFDIYIIPVVNVMGSLANTRTNNNGVDLNRNFPASCWVEAGYGTDTYSGPSAGSEFETQVIVAFTNSLNPDMTVDHHNYSDGKNNLYTELFYKEQQQLGMQCGVDNAIAFSKGLPSYFGTAFNSELFGTYNSVPKQITGQLLAHMNVWWFEQGIKFPCTLEICNTIGWQNGERSETSLDWMGNDTFSVAEYCLSNQIFHYAEWVLKNVE